MLLCLLQPPTTKCLSRYVDLSFNHTLYDAVLLLIIVQVIRKRSDTNREYWSWLFHDFHRLAFVLYVFRCRLNNKWIPYFTWFVYSAHHSFAIIHQSWSLKLDQASQILIFFATDKNLLLLSSFPRARLRWDWHILEMTLHRVSAWTPCGMPDEQKKWK